MHVADPVTAVANPLIGRNALVVTQLPDGSEINPDDIVVYDPPIQVLVCSAGDVAIVPYGMDGDRSLIYTMAAWRTVPVLAKQVLATGTTAGALFGQKAFAPPIPTGPTADSTLVTADSTTITADHF